MALIVEDGTGLPDAQAYVSVPDADRYVSDVIGDDGWAQASDADKERALRRAAQYIDARYRYKNSKLNSDQALEWPRVGFPWPIKRVLDASCELAVRARTGDLYVDVAPDDNIKRDTVGPLTTEYFESQNGGQIRFAIVDDLLEPLVASGYMTHIRLERT